MTKGKLMKLVYIEEELRNVDSAIPIELWDKVDTSIHVMDYNNSCLGELVNLQERLKQQEEEIRYEELAMYLNAD